MTEHINITNLSAEEILDYLRKWYKYNKVIYDTTGDDIIYFPKTIQEDKQELLDAMKKTYSPQVQRYLPPILLHESQVPTYLNFFL